MLERIEKYYEKGKKTVLEKDLEFPVLICFLREAIGLKQKTVADVVGLSRFQLGRLERGEVARDFTDERLNRLADLYGVSAGLLRSKYLLYLAKIHEERIAT